MAFDLAKEVQRVAGKGGRINVPAGVHILTAPLVLPANVIIAGEGWGVSVIEAAHTGDGIQSHWPLNRSNAANIRIEDLTIRTSSPDNNGAAFSDIAGTYVVLRNVQTIGFNIGVQFDQTEISKIDGCYLTQARRANIWLVNGCNGAGGDGMYTNRISIENCQIDGLPTAVGLIDDGGYSHSVRACNFNGCSNHIVSAGGEPISISDCEMESASCHSIVFDNKRHGKPPGCSDVGQGCAHISSCIIVPTSGHAAICILSLGSLTLLDNIFGSTVSAKVIGVSQLNRLFGRNNTNNGSSPVLDGCATLDDYQWR